MSRISAVLCSYGLAVALAVSSAGCVSQVVLRASSSQHLRREQQTAVLPMAPAELEKAWKGLMEGQHLSLANALDAPNGSRILVYKGTRVNVVSVRASSSVVAVESFDVGSWIAARIAAAPAGSQITVFGKPTVLGQEVCSEDDPSLADVDYWCQDTKIRDDSQHRHLVNGKAEAEFITAVLEKLKDAALPPAPAQPASQAAPVPASAPQPPAQPPSL